MSEISEDPIPPSRDEKALREELEKQLRYYNRGEMVAWAACAREIERLVNLIPE